MQQKGETYKEYLVRVVTDEIGNVVKEKMEQTTEIVVENKQEEAPAEVKKLSRKAKKTRKKEADITEEAATETTETEEKPKKRTRRTKSAKATS